MLSIVFLLLTAFIISSLCEVDPLLVDYYVKLIRNRTSAAQSYTRRKDNSEFFSRNVSNKTVQDYGTFDFIIVGAGSSGSVVATRLTEVEHWKILLLEAGRDVDDFNEIPGLSQFLSYSDRDWGYTSTPQAKACYGFENKQCILERGKILGGSGEVNGLMYGRGNARNYDEWEELGNPGWSYRNILKYFKKSENSQIPNADEEYHGFSGPINNAYVTPTTQFNEMFRDAFLEIGFKEVDYNGAQQKGVSLLQNNIKFGRRSSGARNYVNPSRNRMNFNVTLQAYVTKILIDTMSKTAHGVLFIKNGVKYRATASKEVIISAGSVNTPQLLMLSGIGPKEELRKHNIKLISDLPVGISSRDHVGFRNLLFTTNITLKASLTEIVEDYLEGRGALTGSGSSGSISFMNLRDRDNELPDVEYLMIPSVGVEELAFSRSYIEGIGDSLAPPANSPSYFAFIPIILNPKSTGKITLRSANPIDFPNLDLGLLTAEEDLDKLYLAARFAVSLSKTEAFRKVNATPSLTIKPCQRYTFNSRKFWYCIFKYLAYSYYHISGTARMGPPSDPLAVVNYELKVYDVRNLRIVDCSILPDLITGHTNAVAFVIGEKAADMIKSRFMDVY